MNAKTAYEKILLVTRRLPVWNHSHHACHSYQLCPQPILSGRVSAIFHTTAGCVALAPSLELIDRTHPQWSLWRAEDVMEKEGDDESWLVVQNECGP